MENDPGGFRAMVAGSMNTYEDAYAYLAERGIDKEQLSRAGLYITPARDAWARLTGRNSSDNRIAINIPHYDINGELMDWFSVRFVRGEGVVVYGDPPKLMCPKGVPVHAYLPKFQDWLNIPMGETIYVHESAIKALNGARLGKYSVGLNGVYGFSAGKYGELVEEFMALPWKERELKCKVVFDSDADGSNSDVSRAIAKLAEILHRVYGTECRHILLPHSPEGEKWGFDDACVRMGDEWAQEYLEGTGEEIQVSRMQASFNDLNERVAYVRQIRQIVEFETGTIMKVNEFITGSYAPWKYREYDAEGKLRVVDVPRLWMEYKHRTEVTRIDYMPEKPLIVNGVYNAWRGSGLVPTPGDWDPFWELLLSNMDEDTIRYFMQWLAYPLQNPGAKLNTYVHICGGQGMGKGRIVETMREIYGSGNCISISRQQIAGSFNSIMGGRQLVHIDEMHAGKDDHAVAQKIKQFVTDKHMIVNTKNVPEYEVANCANLITTTNFLDAVKLDKDDRRAFVIHFRDNMGLVHDQAFWKSYQQWLEGGGAAHLYYELLEYDMEGFDPNAWAPSSEDKETIRAAGMSPVEEWVDELWVNPDILLGAPHMVDRSVFTARELAELCFGKLGGDLTIGHVKTFGRIMQQQGFKQLPQMRVHGTAQRLWIVRGRDKQWSNDAAKRDIESKTTSPKGV